VTTLTLIDWKSKAIELVDEDKIATMDMLIACLEYMSQQEIEDMLKINGFILPSAYDAELNEVCF
jgi:hypothetical protein